MIPMLIYLGGIPTSIAVMYRFMGSWDIDTGEFGLDSEDDKWNIGFASVLWPIFTISLVLYLTCIGTIALGKKAHLQRIFIGKRPEHIEKAIAQRQLREAEHECGIEDEYPL